MLEVGEIVLTDDLLAGEGSKELAEDHEHRRRSGPVGDHAVGHLKRVEHEGRAEPKALAESESFTLARQKAAAQRTL